MTLRQEKFNIPAFPTDVTQGKLSDDDLANFLRSLAVHYRTSTVLNLPLSAALDELASWVRTRSMVSKKTSKLSKPKSISSKMPLDAKQLKELDIKAVEIFIADERKSKIELIELAAARFSIPRAQLKRLKTHQVRETIKAACLHEDSIEIISQEASRDGAKRSS